MAQSLFDQFASGSGQAGKIQNQKPKKQKTPKIPKTPAPSAGPSSTSVAPSLTGQYDPALDAQYRASQRGVQNLQEDAGTAGTRAGQDLMTTLTLAKRNTQRAEQDFGTQLQGLFRQYGLQGQQQAQAANAAGVLHGGTLDAASKVRAGNLAFARHPIDVGRVRALQDLGTATTEAKQRFTRAGEDRNTKVQRAIAEGAYYGSDLNREAIYQASQNNPDLLALLGGKGGAPKKPKQQKTPKAPKQQAQPKKKKGK